jgi:hypothetical protein
VITNLRELFSYYVMINGDWWQLFWVYGVNKEWGVVRGGMVYNELGIRNSVWRSGIGRD